ncbi:MAG: DUF1700 domain-containing protein [Lachnospiraceae bacterium]|nr:DUF1700 domain-containing protein [Lachnospiraceae bacterium]
MTRQEFMEKLRLALNGRVSSEILKENMQFYEDYINVEIRKGRTEEEVMEGLGDPRLIARTIAETSGSTKSAPQEERGGEGRSLPLVFRLPLWVWLLAVLLILAVILSVVFSVISMVLPVLIPILLVLLLVKVFRDWFN